ncbi:MAG: hypothetical protein Q8K86_05830 [Candidatus Nanopelagicaceae bacterium]|nr:hypothetical protein [Candidatus Nanopelagicaceae bacterium]
MLNAEELNRALDGIGMSDSSSKIKDTLSDLRNLRHQQDGLSKELSSRMTDYLKECRETIELATGCRHAVSVDEDRHMVSIFLEGGGELRLKPIFSSNLWDFSGTLGESFEEHYGSTRSIEQDLKILARDVADFLKDMST